MNKAVPDNEWRTLLAGTLRHFLPGTFFTGIEQQAKLFSIFLIACSRMAFMQQEDFYAAHKGL
jgi:hypothetical protein